MYSALTRAVYKRNTTGVDFHSVDQTLDRYVFSSTLSQGLFVSWPAHNYNNKSSCLLGKRWGTCLVRGQELEGLGSSEERRALKRNIWNYQIQSQLRIPVLHVVITACCTTMRVLRCAKFTRWELEGRGQVKISMANPNLLHIPVNYFFKTSKKENYQKLKH